MNKLFLIGNGFDLAHGLKTRYSDFINWLLKEKIREALNKSLARKIDYLNFSYNTNDTDFLEEILKNDSISVPIESINPNETENKGFSFSTNNPLLRSILEHSKQYNWVDIEQIYFDELIKNYLLHEKKGLYSLDKSIESRIKTLNDTFEFLKNNLDTYLKTVEYARFQINPEIDNRISEAIDLENYRRDRDEVLFLNFNYTPIAELYYNRVFSKVKPQLINIHGSVLNKENPIIFGYGDEMNTFYGKIENLNYNEALKHFKSFSYLKTSNYQDLCRFIDNPSNIYEVIIIGHSCGLSDRVLLNRIFENPHCVRIKIYFHQIAQNEDDFFIKSQEISRHFSLQGKSSMREKIVPYEYSRPLVANKN